MATAQQQKELSGTTIKQYENLKTLLKNVKAQSQQSDLYSHLSEVFKKLILHYPTNSLDKLEEVSYLLKHKGENLSIEDYLVLQENKNYKEFTDCLEEYIKKMQPHFQLPKNEDEESEEPPELNPIGYVPDLMTDYKIFEQAGLSFGESETYRIMKSLKKLAQDSGSGNVRFFGKIYGTERDYYIAEGTLEGDDEVQENEDGEQEEKPADFEERGTGVNKYVYWVSGNILDKWIKLPDLQTKDIIAARTIKVKFTGNLERQIYTNPYFFGQEKHYLRAQIARITHSTTLCPKGLYRIVEDNDREIEDNEGEDGEEIKMPTTIQMTKPENWLHYSQNILRIGRVSHMEPEVPEDADEDVDPEELKKQIEKQDPYEPRLKPIVQDQKIKVAENSQQLPWIVRHYGDKKEYIDQKNPKQILNYGVVAVRSLQWPGSYIFYTNGRQLSIYVGSGLKYETQSYYPLQPPKVMDDPLEFQQQPEPTPLEEPPKEEEYNENEEVENQEDNEQEEEEEDDQ